MKLDRKNKFLIFSFIPLAYLCYSFAISKTFYYREEFERKKNIIEAFGNKSDVIPELRLKEKQIDQIIAGSDIPKDSFQNYLLKKLTQFSEGLNLVITDFKEPHTFIKEGKQLNSYSFTIEGSFLDVLSVVNDIENDGKLGLVLHIDSLKKRNYSDDSEFISTQIILQKF